MIVLIKTLQVILALSILILVHEFGHFFFAKIFGIRVDKFYIIDSNGNASAGAIKAGFENSAYSNLFIKMFGFGDKKDAEFTIGAYVEIVNDGASEYSYLQIGEPKEGEKYAFIKYNDFVSQ